MVNKIAFQSNTKGKLEKIMNGSVFTDTFTVVTEMFQNAYRAQAKNIEILLSDDVLTFKDDGTGCKKPENIITLDYSEWESTTEGFGIGLLSFLAVPQVEYAKIASKNWVLTINVCDLLKGENALANVEWIDEPINGFYVEIKSPYFLAEDYWLSDRIVRDGELQPCDVYFNGRLIPRKDLFKDVNGDFCWEFDCRQFIAKICISKKAYHNPSIYYEKRYVQDAYEFGGYANGIVELKKGAVILQEPDRKGIVTNEKSTKFYNKLHECKKTLFLEFLKSASHELIDEYAEAIADVLSVDDYEKLIELDDVEVDIKEEKRDLTYLFDTMTRKEALEMLLQNFNAYTRCNTELTVQDNDNICALLNFVNATPNERWVNTGRIVHDSSLWQIAPLTEDLLQNVSSLVIGGTLWEKIEIESGGKYIPDHEGQVSFNLPVKVKKKKRVLDIIRKTRKKVWMRASEMESLSDLRAKAEYYGVKVFVGKNVLYEKIYEKHNISHILKISEGIKIRSIISNAEPKTNKEKTFLWILSLVETYLNLPNGTFRIADLKNVVETWLDEKIIDREVITNTKNEIRLKGLCDGGYIYLDRKALGLQRFNLVGDFGKNHYRAVLGSLMTIAHELAHLKYNTVDNTIEHYNKQVEIYDELEKYFNSL